MAEVVLFHHAQGLTPGIVAFADELRGAGHTVHMPELFGGRTFDSVEQGMAFVEETGFEDLVDRGVRAAEGFPAEVVYAGFSFGVVPAEAGSDAAGRPRRAVLLLLRADLLLRTVAGWRAGPDPR